MIFTRARLLVALILLALGSGCATAPGDKKRRPAAENAGPLAAAGAPVLPAGPAQPNPYLQHNTKVSDALALRFAEATAAMDAGDWARAQALLLSLAEQQPKLSGVQLNLGWVYRAQGDDARAKEAFARAIAANANNVEAYNAQALLARESGQFDDALGLYQQALQVWPWHPASHKNIAILYELYLGKPELALSHYEAYQQLMGDNDKQINSWIADLQRRLGITPKARAPAVAAATSDAPSETAVEADNDTLE